jgi:hypothetical protein
VPPKAQSKAKQSKAKQSKATHSKAKQLIAKQKQSARARKEHEGSTTVQNSGGGKVRTAPSNKKQYAPQGWF